MKILQLLLHSGSGGAETVAALLSLGWEEQGHTVRTIALTSASSGVQAQSEGWFAPMSRIVRVRSALRALEPDMVVAHATLTGLYARVATLFSQYRGRVVVVAHSASDDYANTGLLLAELVVSLAAPATWLSVSEKGVNWLRARPIRGRSTAKVIANPVSTALRGLVRQPQQDYILMLGRVVPQKDVLQALAIVSRITPSRPNVRMDIAGSLDDEPYVQAVNDRILELNLHDHVRLIGVQEDVPGLLRKAAVLLHTAEREAASQTLREAFAASTPIVATTASLEGVPDVTPFASFPPGDTELAVQGVISALAATPRKIGTQVGLFDPSRVAADYIKHFQSSR